MAVNRMDEHAEIREQLALLIAGALDADVEARITRHVATCADCAAELTRWQLIGGGLRRLPTPQPSHALFERTRARVIEQMEAETERRQNRITLVLLVFFSWAVTLLAWPVFRFATGGFFSLLDIRFHQVWLLFGIFSTLTWLAGGSAAILLSVRREHERRLAL
jgi:anti-sigma factor RsiW